MFYDVSIRRKGSQSVLAWGECGDAEINLWRQKARKAANTHKCEILLSIKPKEKMFSYFPNAEIKPSPPKRNSRDMVMEVDMCDSGG